MGRANRNTVPPPARRVDGPTFPLRHRLGRLVWTIAWRLLGTWTPTPCFAWRRLLLRAFGARLHGSAKVYPGVRVWRPANLAMAEFSCLGPDVICYAMADVSLGPHALVSQRAHLCAGSHDVDDAAFALVARPIRIEAFAWVAAEAFVGPGVTVGAGAVLGARAVTARDLAPWTVFAGNPARPVRTRRHAAPAAHA